jgi:glutathione S-transferase
LRQQSTLFEKQGSYPRHRGRWKDVSSLDDPKVSPHRRGVQPQRLNIPTDAARGEIARRRKAQKLGLNDEPRQQHNGVGRRRGVLDRRLAEREFVADTYSIADIAIWPWVSRFEWQTVDLGKYPNVKRWYETIARRPAVQRGYDVPKRTGDIPMP